MITLLSVQDQRGFRGFPKGLYFLTDVKDLLDQGPEVKGSIFYYISTVLTSNHPKSIIQAQVPEEILNKNNLPKNTTMDMNNVWKLCDSIGTVGDYSVYEILPVTLDDAMSEYNQASDKNVFLNKPK